MAYVTEVIKISFKEQKAFIRGISITIWAAAALLMVNYLGKDAPIEISLALVVLVIYDSVDKYIKNYKPKKGGEN